MRILLVNPKVGDAFGQERVLRDSSILLRQSGHQIGILAESKSGQIPPHDGLFLIPGLSALHWLSPRSEVNALQQKAEKAISEFRPDAVHFYDQFDYRLMDWCVTHFPTVLTSHTVAPSCPSSTRHIYPVGACGSKSGWSCLIHSRRQKCLSFLKSPLHQAHALENHLRRQRVLKKIPVIGAISRYVERTLLAEGFSPSQVRVIYNPIAETSPRPYRRQTTPLIVSACRLNDHKGVKYFLDALQRISRLSFRAEIYGDGPLRHQLEKKTLELCLSDRVQFRGTVSYSHMQARMGEASIFVQPNCGPEPFGLSVAEASAMGIPVVASRVAALDEIVENGVNGFLVTPGDADALATQLAELIQNPNLCEELSKAGPSLMKERFSPEKHLKGTLEAYQMSRDSRLSRASISLSLEAIQN